MAVSAVPQDVLHYSVFKKSGGVKVENRITESDAVFVRRGGVCALPVVLL